MKKKVAAVHLCGRPGTIGSLWPQEKGAGVCAIPRWEAFSCPAGEGWRRNTYSPKLLLAGKLSGGWALMLMAPCWGELLLDRWTKP